MFNCSIELKIEHFEHFEHLRLFGKVLKMNILIFSEKSVASLEAFNLNNKLNTSACLPPEEADTFSN